MKKVELTDRMRNYIDWQNGKATGYKLSSFDYVNSYMVSVGQITEERFDMLTNWCVDNIGSAAFNNWTWTRHDPEVPYTRNNCWLPVFFFKDEKKAVEFKLKWG